MSTRDMASIICCMRLARMDKHTCQAFGPHHHHHHHHNHNHAVPCQFCGGADGDGHFFWECTLPPLVEIRETPEFHGLMEIGMDGCLCLGRMVALSGWRTMLMVLVTCLSVLLGLTLLGCSLIGSSRLSSMRKVLVTVCLM